MRIKSIQIIIICMLIVSSFFLIGCSSIMAPTSQGTNKAEFLPLNENTDGYRFIIVTDPDTGVQYIFYSAGYQSALTVRLNADGTPVTVPVDKEK